MVVNISTQKKDGPDIAYAGNVTDARRREGEGEGKGKGNAKAKDNGNAKGKEKETIDGEWERGKRWRGGRM